MIKKTSRNNFCYQFVAEAVADSVARWMTSRGQMFGEESHSKN